MPCKTIGMMSDNDLGSLIAYMKTVPVSDKTWPDPSFTFMSKVMAGAGMFGSLYEAELIDLTDNKPKTNPEPGPTVEYGEYTVGFHGCKSCHGETLNGFLGPDPVSPPGANITPGGNIGKWSLDQFKETLQTGLTPEGKKLDPKFMPWTAMGQMTEMELEAVYNYLKTVPAMSDSEEIMKWNEKNKK
jgi:mono/diheme cytochrome c family protein